MEYPESGTVDTQSHLKENTLLRFRVGPFRFSVPAIEVEGIIVPPRLTVIPLNPPHSKGVFMYHQRLASAISLRGKFGLPDNNDENLGQLILGEVKTGLVGFWVDEVYETIDSTELEWREMPGIVPHAAFESFAVRDNDIVMASNMQKLYDVPAEAMASMLASVRQNFNLPADMPPVAAEGTALENEGNDEDVFGDLVEPSRTEAPVNSESKSIESVESMMASASEPISTVIDFAKSRGMESGSSAAHSRAAKSLNTKNPASVVRPNPGQAKKIQANPASSHAAGMHGGERVSSYNAARSGARTSTGGIRSRSGSGSDTYNSRPQLFSGGTYADSVNRVQQEYSHVQPTSTGSAMQDPGEKRSRSGAGWLLTILLLLLIGLGYWLWPNERKDFVSTEISGSAATESNTANTPEIPQNRGPVNSVSGSQAEHATPTTPTTKKSEDASEPASNKPDSSEVYRLEGKDVTVTVERNKPEQLFAQETPQTAQQSDRESRRDETQTQPGYREFVHIVVKGDTLWDIAKKYLKNPFRYPELARLSEIKNPDLIYPGDTVRIRAREEK